MFYSVYVLLSVTMFKLATINVAGLQRQNKRHGLFRTLLNCTYDVITLQETHCSDSDEDKNWKTEWPGVSKWSTVSSNSVGVATLFKPNLDVSILSERYDPLGRILALKFTISRTTFQLINVYAPNPETNDRSNFFFNNIEQYIDPSIPPIIAGDFNMVIEPFMDRLGGAPAPRHSYGSRELQDILHAHDLIDVWRSHHPTTRKYTWHHRTAHIRSRLDRIYIPRHYNPYVTFAAITHFVWSDHNVCVLKFTPSNAIPRGKGYWRLNIEYLSQPSYQLKIKTFWTSWRERKHLYPTIAEWWDIGKSYIKRISIQHAVEEYSRVKTLQSELENQVELERLAKNHNRVAELLTRLKDLEISKNRKIFIHTHTTVRETNEEPSAYFYSALKSARTHNSLDQVIGSDGTTKSTQPEIMAEVLDYYSNLYTEALDVSPEHQDAFLSRITRTLTADQRERLERPVDTTAISLALSTCKPEKSPGPDGLPYEFYTTFSTLLRKDLIDLFNSILFDDHPVPHSYTKSILSLLYKKDDKRLLDNWRPISLLCCDYKILTKILAQRLKLVLSSILTYPQSAGVPGRCITNNLHIMRDFLFFADFTHLNGYILSLDQRKAFDLADRNFLFRILHAFNFGPLFIHWIKKLHHSTIASVLVNGFMTPEFPIQRGVRQGCPLAAQLYTLYIEPLNLALNDDEQLIPFPIEGPLPPTAMLYEDDITLLLLEGSSIQRVFDICHLFYLATGSELNHSKTKALLLGRAHRPGIPFIQWVNRQGLKILGVTFYTDFTHTKNQNEMTLIDTLKKDINRFRRRHLSLKGKVLILNSIVLAKLWHYTSVIPFNPKSYSIVQTLISDYLWGVGKRPIKIETVYLPKHLGGLGLKNPLYQQWAIQSKLLYDVVTPTINCPHTQLARYWLAPVLSTRCPQWHFLSNYPQVTDPRRSMPSTDSKLFDAFCSLNRQKVLDAFGNTKWTTKGFYQLYFQRHILHTPKSQIDFWQPRGAPSKMWEMVFHTASKGYHQDHHFKFLHRVLPTNNF